MSCRFEFEFQHADASNSNRKVGSSAKRGSSNTKVATKKKSAPKSKLEPKSEIVDGKVVLHLPIRTVSEANCFESWRDRHLRHKQQKSFVYTHLRPCLPAIRLPCRIVLTRFAPGLLDKHDNLPMSFKYIVDMCCAIITNNYVSGKADSDERISIAYDQVKNKEYSIKIEIFSISDEKEN